MREIILALRNRLTTAGYTVFLGKFVDPTQDKLPCVTVVFEQGGESTIQSKPLRQKSLSLVVQHVGYTDTDDPLLELIEHGQGLERALIQPGLCGNDRLEGHAISVQHVKTVLVSDEAHSDVGVAQVQIRITFIQK